MALYDATSPRLTTPQTQAINTFNGDDPQKKTQENANHLADLFRLSVINTGFYDLGAPADLDVIRKRQQALLPILEALRDEAYSELADQFNVLSEHRCRVGIAILYRKPDEPKKISPFFDYTDDYPVVVPIAQRRDHLPEVARDFVTTGTISVSERHIRKPTGLAALTTVSRLDTLKTHDLPETMRIVFPRTLERLIHWVKEIDGPIHRMQVWPTHPEQAQRVIQASMLSLGGRA